MATRRVAVLGAGDMGHGIAELFALRGYEVTIRDVRQDILDKAVEKVGWSLQKLADHRTVTEEAARAARDRLRTTTSLEEAVREADFVVEAVPERLDLKQQVFADVERAAPPHAILASNTSTMRMADISSRMREPARLVGMHFFNPVLLMQLVEVIPGEATPKAVVDEVTRVAESLGKTVVVCHRDSPGFITSRLIGAWVGAAIKLYEDKVASPEQIDSALRFQAGFPMGPFELADYTGLDIGTHAAEYIASQMGDAYRPLPAIRALVDAGHLGKKTGRGFYVWQDGKNTTRITADTGKGVDPSPVLAVVANEAARCLAEGLGSAAEIDAAMRLGCAFPKGPLEWADSVGLDGVLKTLIRLKEKHRHVMFEPSPLLADLVGQGKLGKASGTGFYDHAGRSGAPAGGGADRTGALGERGGSYETILYEVGDDGVATVTLNRPHRLHAISPQLVEDLGRATREAERDERVRVVLVTGQGEKAFCAGADLSDAGDMTPAKAVEAARALNGLLLAWERSPKLFVAAINGHAFGGGLEIALGCDFRVAAQRARMGLTEVSLGLIPASGGTQRLPKLVGLARANEIVLLAEKHDAQRMLEWGVVHRVFANETFAQDARAFAAKLAKGAPVAQRLAKRALRIALTSTNEEGAELEAAAFGILLSTEDAVEGVGALFQRTEPEFKGR